MSTVGASGTLLPDTGRTISALLLDITGVLYESGDGEGKVIQGSPEAVTRYINDTPRPTHNTQHTHTCTHPHAHTQIMPHTHTD